MTITNLTPHTLTILVSDDETRSIPPSGTVARCSASSTPAGDHDGIPLARTSYGAVTDLPEPQDGVLYVVSGLVRAAVPSRTDVASPGELVRDPDGRVIGCRNLVVNG